MKQHPNQKLKEKREIKKESNKCFYSQNPDEKDELDEIHNCSRDGMGLDWSMHLAGESWNPCFDRGLIAVRINEPRTTKHGLPNDAGKVKISIIGADDTCMMMICNSYEEAREIVKRFPIILTQEYLRSIGFEFD